MKKNIILSFLYTLLLNMALYGALLDQPRCTQPLDELFEGSAFLTSFIGDGSKIVVPEPRSYPDLGYLTIIPYIGQYSGTYPMRPILGLIQLDPTMIRYIPESINRIYQRQNVSPQAHINFNVIISGVMDHHKNGKYNFVLHPWAYGFEKQQFFNINPLVSFFELNGIKTVNVGVNNFKPLNVNAHNGGGIYFSPNNGQFELISNREVSTFWSVAISPNKQNVLIAFHILINNEQLEQQFQNAERNAKTLNEYLTNLETLVTSLSRADSKASESAIEILTNIANDEPKQQNTITAALQTLTTNLQNLANAI